MLIFLLFLVAVVIIWQWSGVGSMTLEWFEPLFDIPKEAVSIGIGDESVTFKEMDKILGFQ